MEQIRYKCLKRAKNRRTSTGERLEANIEWLKSDFRKARTWKVRFAVSNAKYNKKTSLRKSSDILIS